MTETVRKPLRASRGLVFFGVILVVALLIMAFVFSQRSASEAVNVATEAPAPIPVRTQTITAGGGLVLGDQFTGMMMARRTSDTGFETGGRVVDVRADVGERVEKGAVLARLDTRALNARLRAAEAQIAEAEAALKIADTTVGRNRMLTEEGLLSSQAFDEASAQSEAAMARLALAKAQADALRVQIDLATLRAPFAGVVTERFLDEGTIAGPGAPILRLVELGAMEVRIGLPQTVATTMVPGDTYTLEIAGQTTQGVLRSLTGVVDASQRTETATFEVAGADGMQPGAVARLVRDRSSDEDGLWVPISAMTEAGRGLWAVYAVEPSGNGFVIEKRLIEVIHAEADRAFVRGSVFEGDRFVIEGLQRLTPGMAVTPVEAGPAGT